MRDGKNKLFKIIEFLAALIYNYNLDVLQISGDV